MKLLVTWMPRNSKWAQWAQLLMESSKMAWDFTGNKYSFWTQDRIWSSSSPCCRACSYLVEYNHITSFVQASLPWLHLDDRWTKDNSNPDSIFGATQPTSLRLSLGTGNAEMLGESAFDVTRGKRSRSGWPCFLFGLRCHPFVELLLAQCLAVWHFACLSGWPCFLLVCWACWSQFFKTCNLECSGWIWRCPRSSRKICCFGLKRASCQLILATFDVKMKAFQFGWLPILSPGNGRWWRKELTFQELVGEANDGKEMPIFEAMFECFI